MSCGTNLACPPCDPDNSDINPCTGVKGYGYNSSAEASGGFPKNPIYKNMIAKDKILCQNDSQQMNFYDKSGYCTSEKPPGANIDYNDRVAQSKPLKVTGKDIQDLVERKTSPSDFPLQAIFKVWGDGGEKKYNYGVSDKNVSISAEKETVVYLDPEKYVYIDTKQNVINLELHGNDYDGDIPGVKKNPAAKKTTGNFSTCPKWVEDPENKKRVGAVVISRDNYGPGVYHVLAYVPKTKARGQRGYVLAMWTFHYEEIYVGKKNKRPQQYLDAKTAPCFNQCDADPSQVKFKNGCPSCNGVDTFSAINHEIDIEIPANSPQLAALWFQRLTWNTMNCNTWLGDNFNYDEDSQSHYTQVMVSKPKGDWISQQDQDSPNKDYHWYTIDWYVDEKDATKNYVKFYFDDPKMKNQPVYSTNRFVPTRAGHLNFGGWFGWWGFGKDPEKYCNFNTATIKIAQVIINPYPVTDFTNHPQTYDQPGINCDAVDFFTHNAPPTTKAPASKIPLVIIIILSILALIVICCLIFVLRRKAKIQVSN